jgi:hypothetical protein
VGPSRGPAPGHSDQETARRRNVEKADRLRQAAATGRRHACPGSGGQLLDLGLGLQCVWVVGAEDGLAVGEQVRLWVPDCLRRGRLSDAAP